MIGNPEVGPIPRRALPAGWCSVNDVVITVDTREPNSSTYSQLRAWHHPWNLLLAPAPAAIVEIDPAEKKDRDEAA